MINHNNNNDDDDDNYYRSKYSFLKCRLENRNDISSHDSINGFGPQAYTQVRPVE